ncbi:MAG: AAA family ATPase, partial [Candidatus Thermoplasmatota archaeon]|nr:AAA family ATPase [Candidatus Thermoplasmatota archaeon]
MAFRSPHPHLNPVFVGRTNEMMDALEFYETHKEDGGMLLVEGKRGMGKSRFIEEVLVQIQRKEEGRGLQIWRTSGKGVDKHPLHAFRAILPWKEMTEEVRENFPAVLLPEFETRFLVFNALITKMAELVQKGKSILVLEDLHLCDDMSLYLLHYLLLNNVPVFVLSSYSPDAPEKRPVLVETLGLMRRERLFQSVTIKSLDEGETGRMVSNMLGRRPPEEPLRRIWKLSEGNPFVVSQIIQSLIQDGKLAFDGSAWEFASTTEPLSLPK